VREGETQNSGEKTVTRRVKEIDEIKELAIMHPLRIKQRKQKRMRSALRTNTSLFSLRKEILILCAIMASYVTFTL
jgi:hypothetical protein